MQTKSPESVNDALSVFNLRVNTKYIQGARGIGARFLKWSPASAFSPTMTKFLQYTPQPTLHLLLSSGVHLPARLKGSQQESQRGVIVKIIRAV
jgi:hypothetical protein